MFTYEAFRTHALPHGLWLWSTLCDVNGDTTMEILSFEIVDQRQSSIRGCDGIRVDLTRGFAGSGGSNAGGVGRDGVLGKGRGKREEDEDC